MSDQHEARQFSTSDLQRHSDTILRQAIEGPVTLTRYRKPQYVLMSTKHYEVLVPPETRQSVDMKNLDPAMAAAMLQAARDFLAENKP
jgi:PHD/YefM family antitoxin component YafN of YafNO toxin-antitoxin module